VIFISNKSLLKFNVLRTKISKTIEVEQKTTPKKERIRELIKKPKEKFLSKSQEEYWNILHNNQITICIGAAGVGKSYISMKKAVDLLWDNSNKYEKIIIVRPAVEAEEKLGSLPGGLEEKLDPYIFPSYYLLNKIIGKDAREKMKNEGFIEVAALAYMRGWNVDNTILIFEEAQNATPSQMKLLLTRIGYNSKFFISGDLEQSDKYRDITKSGLFDAKKRLQNVKDIGIFEFKDSDIIRNPIISDILHRYD
jgi:phosphate starvation-inducible PhoH-like protein